MVKKFDCKGLKNKKNCEKCPQKFAALTGECKRKFMVFIDFSGYAAIEVEASNADEAMDIANEEYDYCDYIEEMEIQNIAVEEQNIGGE